ncbi:Uncharacterised protein [Serratia plymuthica]|nr:Uncharacterised protein [Serratia plymuthica]
MACAQYCIFIMCGYLLRYAPLVIASFVILVLLWNTSFDVIKRRFFLFAGTFTGKYEQSGGRSGFSFAAGILNLTFLAKNRRLAIRISTMIKPPARHSFYAGS